MDSMAHRRGEDTARADLTIGIDSENRADHAEAMRADCISNEICGAGNRVAQKDWSELIIELRRLVHAASDALLHRKDPRIHTSELMCVAVDLFNYCENMYVNEEAL